MIGGQRKEGTIYRAPTGGATFRAEELGEEDLGFGFDDEEGVVGGVAGVAELLEGFVEGGGLDGEDYGAVLAADEVEVAFLLDELEVGGHGRALAGAR